MSLASRIRRTREETETIFQYDYEGRCCRFRGEPAHRPLGLAASQHEGGPERAGAGLIGFEVEHRLEPPCRRLEILLVEIDGTRRVEPGCRRHGAAERIGRVPRRRLTHPVDRRHLQDREVLDDVADQPQIWKWSPLALNRIGP